MPLWVGAFIPLLTVHQCAYLPFERDGQNPRDVSATGGLLHGSETEERADCRQPLIARECADALMLFQPV
jgi:hypothetical protein